MRLRRMTHGGNRHADKMRKTEEDMAGSTYGTIFRIMTWGESHGKGVGVTIDGFRFVRKMFRLI